MELVDVTCRLAANPVAIALASVALPLAGQTVNCYASVPLFISDDSRTWFWGSGGS